jgi:Do/DeqQ family serine protease
MSQPMDREPTRSSPTVRHLISLPQALGLMAVAALASALGTGAMLGSSSVAQQNSELASTQLLAQSAPAQPLPGTQNFITDVVDQVGPAVVRIDTSRSVSNRARPDFEDPFFRRFFGEMPQMPDRQQQGSGSGFILTADGKIITNAHVIDGADQVQVTLRDGREFEGQVIGTDMLTDVAVVQIDATDLPTVSLGDSNLLRPGEWVIAIGNPLGLDNTVTAGIVSATGRSSGEVRVGADRRVEFIQTDAAINPGNSGGPLLNANGEVVGVNTAIIRGAQGLGFSIPINRVREIADQLIVSGRVERAYLGIQMLTLTPSVARDLNADPSSTIQVESTSGVVVVAVQPDSPALRAGLQVGDVITAIGNQGVTESTQVQRLVESSPIDGELQLAIDRQGSKLQIPVRLAALPES